MLNKFIGIGRITAKPELKTTPSGTSVATFTIAVDRDYKSQSGEKATDFLSVVAWRQTAEFVTKYFDKGSLICVEGSVNVRSYKDKDDKNRYITEIVASQVYFAGDKKEQTTYVPETYTANTASSTQHMEELNDDDELPF